MEKLQRLTDLVQSRKQGSAVFNVFSIATVYKRQISIFTIHTPVPKLLPGMVLRNKKPKSPDQNKTSNETPDERSIRRTKKSVFDLVLCNDFELFVTFTFKHYRDDNPRNKKRMSVWLTNQQKISGKFQYVIVSELQKDGTVHFHALIKGYKGKVVLAVHPDTNKPIIQKGRQVYNLDGYKLGWTNVKLIDNKKGSLEKVGFYLLKYVTKDMPIIHGKKRYWASKDLEKPVVIYNPEPFYSDYKQLGEPFTNEYGTFRRYALPEPKNG